MTKRKFINYKEWNIINSKRLNYTILEDNNKTITIQCNKCGAIKTYEIKSIYTNYKNKKCEIHSENCSKYFNNLIKEELGEELLKKFRNFYRYARERCCNPNNKDYKRYAGKWHFEDYIDYYKNCYEEFKKSINKYGIDSKLSIDRINNNKGYEKGNVRFVPISINLQNKDIVIPCMGVNLVTKEIIEANSIGELAKKYFGETHISTIHSAIKRNKLYNKVWKIFYTIETQSTIETTSIDGRK